MNGISMTFSAAARWVKSRSKDRNVASYSIDHVESPSVFFEQGMDSDE